MNRAILPIYKAVNIQTLALEGGTTKPCILEIDTGETEFVPYVVKIVKQSYLRNGHPIHSEVFGNVLTKEFDLNAPKAALIDVPNWIIKEMQANAAYAKYSKYDLVAGVYFGSEYIHDNNDYKIELAKKFLNIEDIATIFAFDTLILQRDRRVHKPNLFFKADDIFLIDHESALVVGTQTYQTLLQRGEFSQEKYQTVPPHLFLDFLRENKHSVDFSLFAEYLKYFNADILDPYAEQLNQLSRERFLEHEGDIHFDYAPIKRYLAAVKSQAPQFINLLNELINF